MRQPAISPVPRQSEPSAPASKVSASHRRDRFFPSRRHTPCRERTCRPRHTIPRPPLTRLALAASALWRLGFFERFARGHSLLRVAPGGVIVRHRLAPITHHAVRVDFGGLAELIERHRVPEGMKRSHTAQKAYLRWLRTGRWKINRAKSARLDLFSLIRLIGRLLGSTDAQRRQHKYGR